MYEFQKNKNILEESFINLPNVFKEEKLASWLQYLTVNWITVNPMKQNQNIFLKKKFHILQVIEIAITWKTRKKKGFRKCSSREVGKLGSWKIYS